MRQDIQAVRAGRGLKPALLVVAAVVVLWAGLPGAAEGGHFTFGLGFYGPYHHPHHVYRPWFAPFYYPWGVYAAPPYGHQVRYAAGVSGLGGVDLNVKPRKTAVYLNGEYIGQAREFDGFPSYLWLEKGTHQIVFHMEGYETVARQISVVPGRVLALRVRMAEGRTTPPQEIAVAPPPSGGAPPAAPSRPPATEEPVLDLRGGSGTVRLLVQPADASVYLDGRFLGTAEQLDRLHSGLVVDPGEHVLEAVRPGLRPERVTFRVEENEDLEVSLVLAASDVADPRR